MTTFELAFLVCLIAFGLMIALILATQKADWEASEIENDSEWIKNFRHVTHEERLERERHEITKPIDLEALEADLLLEDTAVPESAAVLQAIQYLEDLED